MNNSPDFSPSTLIPGIRHIKETSPPEEITTDTEDSLLRTPTIMAEHRLPRPVPPTSPHDLNDKDDDYALITIINRHTDNINKFITKIPTLEKDEANFARWKECTAMALFEMTGVLAYWTLNSPKRDSKWDMAVDHCAY
ncbi:hypothetical protein CROQUDRAFT_99197 [Cronartium quercuum f. sp. fusiforme G11]|uniref:Uncharacterized protein n=1 Tax=Cronartium quercuum f. sp. fusiforme G11 TaxID=708437 RepID=A0A9P6T6R1_9BASI|nr:hypothetical protein CROQUDRAFT_99197 [Cronartium quercuum f. sp. fusiforme G11]